MKISELIELLEKLKDEHGDLSVFVDGGNDLDTPKVSKGTAIPLGDAIIISD